MVEVEMEVEEIVSVVDFIIAKNKKGRWREKMHRRREKYNRDEKKKKWKSEKEEKACAQSKGLKVRMTLWLLPFLCNHFGGWWRLL